ncbi:unnamed protein product [Vitrella brassicaformis CCMP3155]|uniref:arginine--tRNA ligase n=2 Tax=Vitrella brassicaformis TaxID=1169539 RepID=A0A0G4H8A5_VITBC|nr:unnamed protein product [Vitrella brassicaformis CCMP3155]|eukprot:CEM40085.1 unnamed protein product [Vitrella brassicaformis CCMP3155]
MASNGATDEGATAANIVPWLEQQILTTLREDLSVSEDALTSAVSAGLITEATRPEFGDYQSNVALVLAKKLKTKPRDLAQRFSDALYGRPAVQQVLAPIEIAGPGFVNFRLSDSWVLGELSRMHQDRDGRLAIPTASPRERVVIDYSSPNIAKEMHVGHLRSTIIGDALARVLDFLGHDVVRLNHVGDWGTQFGMLISQLKDVQPDVIEQEGASASSVAISDLVAFYKEAKKRFDEDEAFQERSRNEVVKLQSGDPASLKAWRILCDISRKEFGEVYEMLGIQGLEERGESFYNPFLKDVVKELEDRKLSEESQGAKCVFLDPRNEDGSSSGRPPVIVQKSDGGFMYSTTDLAAIKHRVWTERADRVLYVVDQGQSSHFSSVFEVAKKAGFANDKAKLTHVPFGLVLGEDGKKFKTRSGDTVKLRDLLNEAVRLADEDLQERQKEDSEAQPWPDEERTRTATVIGLASVKYADLSMNRESNYQFSYSKMLSRTGNTAPYMLYALVRIKGIRRKAQANTQQHDKDKDMDKDAPTSTTTALVLTSPAESSLMRHLLKFPRVIQGVADTLYPHKLCEHLFELSQLFNQFYETCPVVNVEDAAVRASRTAICEVTERVLQVGLDLLGIQEVERL